MAVFTLSLSTQHARDVGILKISIFFCDILSISFIYTYVCVYFSLIWCIRHLYFQDYGNKELDNIIIIIYLSFSHFHITFSLLQELSNSYNQKHFMIKSIFLYRFMSMAQVRNTSLNKWSFLGKLDFHKGVSQFDCYSPCLILVFLLSFNTLRSING